MGKCVMYPAQGPANNLSTSLQPVAQVRATGASAPVEHIQSGPGSRPTPPDPMPEPRLRPVENSGDRRSSAQPTERMIGRVTFCSGARATISTNATNLTGATADFWAVGRLISIEVAKARVVALVYEMRTDKAGWDEIGSNSVSVHVEIVGEVSSDDNGGYSFKRGVSRYPQVGAIAHKIRTTDLEVMHDLGDRMSVEIGRLTQNEDVPATISVEDMLRKHFAVVGTTGVGKSCSVTLLIRQCLAVKPELRVLMLDPHNEFSNAFANDAALLDANSLALPFWLFKFDELIDVIFRNKVMDAEADILRELIGLAKAQFHAERMGQAEQGVLRKSLDTGAFTADTPTPYRLQDVFKLIDDMLGQLEPRFDRLCIKALRVRLESLCNDIRYGFMFPKGPLNDNFWRDHRHVVPASCQW
ncbi:MAG: ATP-binding protein [Hyphomonadaceae bacterium]|nr:ATP-binding protein [Hyphomonadaceae bacterium]